jgi:hypothetical protein
VLVALILIPFIGAADILKKFQVHFLSTSGGRNAVVKYTKIKMSQTPLVKIF